MLILVNISSNNLMLLELMYGKINSFTQINSIGYREIHILINFTLIERLTNCPLRYILSMISKYEWNI